MNDKLRTFLFRWCLSVPGTLVQIVAWLFLVGAMSEISFKALKPDLVSVLAVLLALAAFVVGRLMDLACGLLTGTIRLPENKKTWILSQAYPLGVWICLAGLLSQVVSLLHFLGKHDRVASIGSGAALLFFIATSIAVEIADSRLQKRIRREWKERLDAVHGKHEP